MHIPLFIQTGLFGNGQPTELVIEGISAISIRNKSDTAIALLYLGNIKKEAL